VKLLGSSAPYNTEQSLDFQVLGVQISEITDADNC